MPASARCPPPPRTNLWDAIATDLPQLLRLHDLPPSADLLAHLIDGGFPHALLLPLPSPQGRAALAAVQGALGALAAQPAPAALQGLTQDYAALYLRPNDIDAQGRLNRRGDGMVQQLNVIICLSSGGGHSALCEITDYLDKTALANLSDFALWTAEQRSVGSFYPALSALTLAYACELRNRLSAMVEQPRRYNRLCPAPHQDKRMPQA